MVLDDQYNPLGTISGLSLVDAYEKVKDEPNVFTVRRFYPQDDIQPFKR